jgi:cardiolipin synthase
MNLPNTLSLCRLFLTVAFILLVVYGHLRLALLLFILQALSDLVDGFLARQMGAKTNLGAYLDPLADKVMLASSYIVLCFKMIIPVWLVGMVLLRDLVISLGFLILLRRGLKSNPVPTLISKTTTLFQMLTIVYVLWSMDRPYGPFFFYITALLTIASGFQYVLAGWTTFSKKEMV